MPVTDRKNVCLPARGCPEVKADNILRNGGAGEGDPFPLTVRVVIAKIEFCPELSSLMG